MATTRQLMVKGSEWEAIEDFEFHVQSKCGWTERTNYRDIYMATPTTLTVPKGTKLTVLDKSTLNLHPIGFDKDGQKTRIFLDGLFYPILIEGSQFNSGGYWIEFQELNKKIQITKSIVVPLFVLYSPSKKAYIKPPSYTVRDLEWTDNISKAMKKKRKQDATQFLLEHCGYYDGLDSYGGSWYEAGSFKVDFPKDLEIHEINKDTKEIVETTPCQPYIDSMMRLKPLIVEYGTCVRDLFKEMESSEKQINAILMVSEVEPDPYEKSEKLAEVKKDFKDMKLSKSSYIMKSKNEGVAFGFTNKDDALVFRLQCVNDALRVKVIDPTTLKEIANA